VKVVYREAATKDIAVQCEYYEVHALIPQIASRFQRAVTGSVELIRQHPEIGTRVAFKSRKLKDTRSWPVNGFDAIRIYYILSADLITIIRLLHSARDIRKLLRSEGARFDKD
jgi:plasmid stabilization system protein ParE